MQEEGLIDGKKVPVQTHTAWKFDEEKGPTSKDKELLLVLIGLIVIIVAVLLKTYIFGALIAMATITFIYIGRQQPQKLTFRITNIGLFMNNDFIPKEKILSYNIIDIPGERAHLIVQTEKVISMNEILPIYDVGMEKIRDAFQNIGIKKDTTVKPNIIDVIASFV